MPLRRVLLVLALGVGRHAKAHAHGHHHHLASGGSHGRGAAPGAAPLENRLEDGRGAGGGACAVSSMRMMYDLMVFCREKRWRFEPYGDDRYLVTTGTSATAEIDDRVGEDEQEGEDGFSSGVAAKSKCKSTSASAAPAAAAEPSPPHRRPPIFCT